MNNSSAIPTSTTCNPAWKTGTAVLVYANYNVFPSLRVLLGATSQFVALLAYRKEIKNETGYGYQSFVSIAKITEIIVGFFTYLFGYHFAGTFSSPGGAPWFLNCYPCMWYVAKVTVPLSTTLIVLSLMLPTAMAVDRALALMKPLWYRTINHRRHQLVALGCCILLSILTVVEICWRNDVGAKNGTYAVVSNAAYIAAPASSVLSLIRHVIRISCVAVMISAYLLVLVNLRKVTGQLSQMTGRNEAKEKERKRLQKVLCVLLAYQVPFMFLAHFTAAANSLILFFATNQVKQCEGLFFSEWATASVQVSDMLELYVIAIFSPDFRQLIWKVVRRIKLPLFGSIKSNVIQTA